MKIERYGIYWVDLNPVVGAEIAKIRPCVIVSDDLMNESLRTVVVCPVTSQRHPGWRSRIEIVCGGRSSEIAVDQIRTVSKIRLRDRIDALDDLAAAELRALIVEMYGLA